MTDDPGPLTRCGIDSVEIARVVEECVARLRPHRWHRRTIGLEKGKLVFDA